MGEVFDPGVAQRFEHAVLRQAIMLHYRINNDPAAPSEDVGQHTHAQSTWQLPQDSREQPGHEGNIVGMPEIGADEIVRTVFASLVAGVNDRRSVVCAARRSYENPGVVPQPCLAESPTYTAATASQRFLLELPDPLPANTESLAQFLQGSGRLTIESESSTKNLKESHAILSGVYEAGFDKAHILGEDLIERVTDDETNLRLVKADISQC